MSTHPYTAPTSSISIVGSAHTDARRPDARDLQQLLHSGAPTISQEHLHHNSVTAKEIEAQRNFHRQYWSPPGLTRRGTKDTIFESQQEEQQQSYRSKTKAKTLLYYFLRWIGFQLPLQVSKISYTASVLKHVEKMHKEDRCLNNNNQSYCIHAASRSTLICSTSPAEQQLEGWFTRTEMEEPEQTAHNAEGRLQERRTTKQPTPPVGDPTTERVYRAIHAPFRNRKLSQLQRHSVGGDCKKAIGVFCRACTASATENEESQRSAAARPRNAARPIYSEEIIIQMKDQTGNCGVEEWVRH